jgi:hypothetical protein
MTRRLHLLLLAAAVAAAPKPPAPSRGRRKRIAAWLASGSAEGLKATVEGRPAAIERVLSPQDDLLLLLVLDLADDITRIDAARQAAASAIEQLPASVWAGVLSAQDGLRVLADPSPDRAAAISAIQNAPTTGRAGFLETVDAAARLAAGLAHKAPVRTAVLYLTDSEIGNYREDFTNPVINYSDTRDLSRRFPDALVREKSARLAATLSPSDAPVFAVHLAFRRDRLNEAYQTGLQQIVEATGGQAWFCRNLTEIPEAVAAAFERIRTMHSIDLRLPEGLPKNVTLQLSGAGVELQYRARMTAQAWSHD